jgi:hypothetical protein
MAFLETRTERRVLEGICPVKITLAGAVKAGDCLGYDSGWKLSASATAIQPLLVAGEDGASGELIAAYPLAVVEAVTTAANVATVGEKVALKDDGCYQAAGAGLPDVGYVASIGADNLSAIIVVNPQVPQLTVVRS